MGRFLIFLIRRWRPFFALNLLSRIVLYRRLISPFTTSDPSLILGITIYFFSGAISRLPFGSYQQQLTASWQCGIYCQTHSAFINKALYPDLTKRSLSASNGGGPLPDRQRGHQEEQSTQDRMNSDVNSACHDGGRNLIMVF